MASVEKALKMLGSLPRVTMSNIKDFPEMQKLRKKQHALPRGKDARFKLGADHKGAAQRMSRPRLGFAKSTPGYLRVPKENYYAGHHMLKQYVPVSLWQLQRLIDLGRLNPQEPIDLTSLCNTKLISIDVAKKQYGVQLIDEGADMFRSRINLEVQWIVSETSIAAIERQGGRVQTKFLDRDSVFAMSEPEKFFATGKPIPRNGTPPLSSIEYYTNAKWRGYLANPDQIREERMTLAQKYGYDEPASDENENEDIKKLMSKQKDPRQIWHGLQPGWVVNLKDECVLKPADKEWIEYYKS